MKALMLLLLSVSMFACTTTARMTIPAGTSLKVYSRPVEMAGDGTWTTRPFFWSAAGGIPYKLSKGDQVIDRGTLKSKFRVVSIFWPPAALIYWPMGFGFAKYDFTAPDATKGVRSRAKQ